MITQQDLIDWIDRQPSNDDLDLATFIATRLEKFYDLEQELQQEKKDFKETNDYCFELKRELQQKENIIKEVREYIMTNGIHSDYGDKGIDDENKLLEILDKVDKENK